jgi:hypothetical protein
VAFTLSAFIRFSSPQFGYPEDVTIPDDQAPNLIRALEHYAAYMRATDRDERPYLELADSLKRKGQGKEEPARTAKKKRA